MTEKPASAVSVVTDASPLIYFARMDALRLLHQVFRSVGIPPAVYQEVVIVGQQRGFPDADLVAAAIKRGWLELLTLEQAEKALVRRIEADRRLGPGEVEAIACASHRSVKALLHDRKAREAAARHGVHTWQPADVLFLALLRRYLTWSEFRTHLGQLAIVSGMSIATYREREALAEEIARQLGLKET